MNMRTLALLVLGATMSLAACGDTTTTPGADPAILDDDVALLAADAVQEDLAVMNTVLPAGPVGAPGAMNVQDITRSRVVAFFDAQGVEQDGYDPLTTASVHTLLEMEGTVTRMAMEMSIQRSRDMLVTGLEGEEESRTWNGTGTDERSRVRVSDEYGTRTLTMTGGLLVENVVRGVPRELNPWPLSGTVTRDVVIQVENGPNGDETIQRTVVITFTGEQVVTMTVNGEEYELDLAAAGRDRVRRRHHQGGGM